MTTALDRDRPDQELRRRPGRRPGRPHRRRRRAGRAARPQRQRQDDAAADGRRAAGVDGRHDRRVRPRRRVARRPGRRRRTSATSRCSTTTSASGSTSSTSPGCTAPTTGSRTPPTCWPSSGWPTGPTTCRRRSAGACARRRPSRWPSCGRSSCCSSTSRSSASTAQGREALLELFRRAHRDGAALLVATHELTTVSEAERVVALRDGAVVFDGSADRRRRRRPRRQGDGATRATEQSTGVTVRVPCTSSTPSASPPTRPPRSPRSSPRSPATAGRSSPSCRPGRDITAFLKRERAASSTDDRPTEHDSRPTWGDGRRPAWGTERPPASATGSVVGLRLGHDEHVRHGLVDTGRRRRQRGARRRARRPRRRRPRRRRRRPRACRAGWYADPANRYELRYWDGSAWTEHVSRAGQQYTDPPVA